MINLYKVTDLTTSRLVTYIVAKSLRSAQIIASKRHYNRFNQVSSAIG
jgi:hypothetical protein